MKLMCRVFGHALPPPGWWGDVPYGDVRGGTVDNIGRTHFALWQKCGRCGDRYLVGRFHGGDAIRAANTVRATTSIPETAPETTGSEGGVS